MILLPHDIESWSTPEERVAIIRHECIHFNEKAPLGCDPRGTCDNLLFFHPLFDGCARNWTLKGTGLRRGGSRNGADPDGYAETLSPRGRTRDQWTCRGALCSEGTAGSPARLPLSSASKMPAWRWSRFRSILLTPLLTLGFWQTRAETFELIQSEWLARCCLVCRRKHRKRCL